MINYSDVWWRRDPASIPPVAPGRKASRRISGGPLFKLDALKSLLQSGNFDTEQLWIATDKCEQDLRKERWSVSDVLHMLLGLDGPQDYYKSEWCEVIGGRMVPCDVYRTPFDAVHKCRHPKGMRVYIKFSIELDGALTIALVSCHEG